MILMFGWIKLKANLCWRWNLLSNIVCLVEMANVDEHLDLAKNVTSSKKWERLLLGVVSGETSAWCSGYHGLAQGKGESYAEEMVQENNHLIVFLGWKGVSWEQSKNVNLVGLEDTCCLLL